MEPGLILSQKVLPQPFRIIFNRSRRIIAQILYCRAIFAVSSTLRGSERVHKDLNVIVALMSKCVHLCERKKHKDRERSGVCSKSGVIFCAFQAHFVSPGFLF